ncbi:GNAT family N-acetyltransferase [Dokdonella sp.]|uniref:GNAT family N-acetyltransferase n=1 Tax=Dokdonella sp. TaxID=2291710 RepID=UPI001B2E6DD5|nr:GNAT family N-acetyltransferase [Dokdonella sp.]MBO9664999.1 GNAT family N-acetyltransferase [Dokdonella sp.]
MIPPTRPADAGHASRRLHFEVVSSEAVRGDLRGALLSLCSRAYEEDFSPFLALLSPAVHLLARLDGELVSHAAWVERELRAANLAPLRTAYVEAVATAPEHQGKGYASDVLTRIPALVGDFALAALSPSDDGYYRRLGWELWRGPLSYLDPCGVDINTPGEQVMIHRLPSTPPALDLDARLSTDWRPGDVW